LGLERGLVSPHYSRPGGRRYKFVASRWPASAPPSALLSEAQQWGPRFLEFENLECTAAKQKRSAYLPKQRKVAPASRPAVARTSSSAPVRSWISHGVFLYPMDI
jgi:hypothetical protein